MENYLEKPIKKKKKHDRESEKPIKAKPSRNFQIIDDDIGLNSLIPTQEQEILVDLLDPEGPAIADDDVLLMDEKPKVVNKVDLFTNNTWIQVDVCETDEGDLVVGESQSSKSLFKKRGEKLNHSNQNKNSDNDEQDSDLDIPRRRSDDPKIKKEKTSHSKNNSQNDSDLDDLPRRGEKKRFDDDLSPKRRRSNSQDSDLDYVPRRRTKDISPDLSPPRHKSTDKDRSKSSSSTSTSKIRVKEEKDLSPDRKSSRKDDKESEKGDETKVRVRKLTKEEEAKKIKEEEMKKKYADWKKGLLQVKQQEEKLKDYMHEVDKPLARHADDKDLEKLLKSQEREDDPMLEYMRKQTGDQTKEPAKKYRGPPAPPNRYNIMPGSKWDGVDRSNGFEKKFFASVMDKKARQEEAYKWSVEDM